MSGTPHEAQRSRLEPCPFCGGEAHASLAAYASGATAHVACDGCGAKVLGYGRGERGLRDAVKRWNRRAERTCRMIFLWSEFEDGECYKCSDCGEVAFTHGSIPSYCPHCGAKVVGCDDA